MTARTSVHNLQVATSLYDFIEQQVLPAVGVKSDKFWKGFSDIVTDLAPILFDQALLAEGGLPDDPAAYVKRVNALLV